MPPHFHRLSHLLISAAAGFALSAFAASPALAQVGGGFGPGTGEGFGPQPSRPQRPQQGPQKDSDLPETHAASGAGDALVTPGGEPSLPDEPLAIPEELRSKLGSDATLDDEVPKPDAGLTRSFYGLLYEEGYGPHHYFRTSIPPLWFERVQPSLTDPTQPDRASLFGLYYNRRSAERADDVLFPLFWNLRDTESRTTVVGPFVNRITPNESDHWLAPLYFHGSRPGGGYTIIPPLLTYMNSSAEEGLSIIGPAFCSWTGGGACDAKNTESLDIGLAPLYFSGHDPAREYRLIPPLLHYHRYDKQDHSSLDLWGPVYSEHTENRDRFYVFPFFFRITGENNSHTTLLPFFHQGHKGAASLHVNPLFLSSTSEEGYETFITWGYARYRGKTELDMFTPLYWHYRDPEIGLDQKILAPLFMRRTSPREDSLVLFPFYANRTRHGLSETTWVTPFFSHTTDLRGWSTNIYPFLFTGRNGQETHTVIAPLFWDFAGPTSRSTIGFPLYWRFATDRKLTQLVGNVYYTERKVEQGSDWKLSIFPFFSYGETPDGHSWDILLGLAGYERSGSRAVMRTFWVPIELSE